MLKEKTCEHLDKHLVFSATWLQNPRPKEFFYTDDIDLFSIKAIDESKNCSVGAWEFYKRIKRYGLQRDQIGVVIRKYVLGMSNRQILEDMGWTSHNTLNRRLKSALKVLRARGFRGSNE